MECWTSASGAGVRCMGDDMTACGAWPPGFRERPEEPTDLVRSGKSFGYGAARVGRKRLHPRVGGEASNTSR